MVNHPACSIVHLICIAALLFLGGCSLPHKALITPQTLPDLRDDSDLASLQSALDHQIRYLQKLDGDATLVIGQTSYSVAWLVESLATFQEIIELDPAPLELERILSENFTIYQAGGRRGHPRGEMLVTGYYEPLLQGSLTPVSPYMYPLYSPPDDLVERTDSAGNKTFGRVDTGGEFLPYWTREEIDDLNLLQGYELVFLKDPLDAFILHIQGSGKVLLRDGSIRALHYRANNGHPYSSIGKLLVDENKLQLEKVDTEAIRNYLQENPQERSRIFNHNRRYIFFDWGNSKNPKGSIGEILTPGRSIALDNNVLPMGTIAYLISRQPVLAADGTIERWAPLHRFVLPQDSGGAIEGAGRVDLFWGSGSYAETAAGAMREKGSLYFLIKNDYEKIAEE